MTIKEIIHHPRVWATLITSDSYLDGVLTLHYSLQKCNSKYPLLALYTNKLSQTSIHELHAVGIQTILIETLNPIESPNLNFDKRFIDTWSKLYCFKLTSFKRIVQLDCDMLILQNMDELMDIPLNGNKFASTHACVCNPLKFSHYPKEWNSNSCVFSDNSIDHNTTHGPSSELGLSKCNSGILIVEPSLDLFDQIVSKLQDPIATSNYLFPDQDLLADVFYQNWLPLSYIYNCLKTFKFQHPHLWDINRIKNIHYILAPKPWNVDRSYNDDSNTFQLWWDLNDERIKFQNSIS